MNNNLMTKLEDIHNELWQHTMQRLDEKQGEPNGAFLVHVFSYDDGYVTTAAQAHVDPSDLVNIGSELVIEGVLQLIAKLSNYDGDDEDIKNLTPIDVAEAGIEKAVDLVRSRVRRAVTQRLKGDIDEHRQRIYVDAENTPIDPDTMKVVEIVEEDSLQSGVPTDGLVQ